MSATRALARVRALPLEKMQLWMSESIFLIFFMSVWVFKIWYVATLAVVAATALMVAIPALRLRGLAVDVAPLAIYFIYLYVAAGWSEFASYARFWVAADGVGILIFALFWIAARNNAPYDVMQSFMRVMLVTPIVYATTETWSLYANRFGGYTIGYLPSALPFLWALIVHRVRRFPASIALGIALVVLLISRSRAPLMSAAVVLGLSILLIGKSLRQKVKLAVTLFAATLTLGVLLVSYAPTRYFLLVFVSRITRSDVLTGDVYIEGTEEDPTRANLRALVREKFADVQPFGSGYMTTERFYERRYWEPFALHDLYQTWAFEGGLVCVLIVAGIFVQQMRALRYIRRFGTSPDAVVLGRCIGLALIAALMMGMFHQMHHGPILYSLLGLAMGSYRRVRDERVGPSYSLFFPVPHSRPVRAVS